MQKAKSNPDKDGVKNQKDVDDSQSSEEVKEKEVIEKTTTKKATKTSTKTKKKTSKGPEPTTMDELMSQLDYQVVAPKKGNEVTGTVISVSPKHLHLNIGGKSEGVVHEKEMPFIGDFIATLKEGDKVTAHVVNSENDNAQVVVTLRRTALGRRWERLAEMKEDGVEMVVLVKESSRGGFIVEYHGLRGFLPQSQASQDIGRLRERAVGRKITVKIIEAVKETNRLIFSQQAGAVLSKKQKETLKKVVVGQTYEAEITGVVQFGAFAKVKIEDVELPGLIHISEIAWEKVENPGDYVEVGKKKDIKIIGVDLETGKLTLSLKQLIDDPWEDVAKVFTQDQKITGKITRTSPYGVFVSLLPGIEGLVHISKIAPGVEPKVGEEIDCVIEEINTDKRKISLSMVSYEKPIGYR